MSSDATQWTIIRAAADGSVSARSEFARRYESVIRAYLAARWKSGPLRAEVDDAAQEVFVRILRPDGPLDRADPTRPGGFRAFLYGVVRNVARSIERTRAQQRRRHSEADLDALHVDESTLSKVFDRAWAQALLRDAALLQLTRARVKGDDAVLRHRLLATRYGENLPIREIAARWKLDAAFLHREYPKAREEFKRALMDVIREQQGGAPESVEKECARLLDYFS